MKNLFFVALLFIKAGSLFSQTADRIIVIDTRSVNDAPSAFGHEARFHFKQSSVVGLPTSANYSGVMTFAPWGTDDSGNKHHQIGFNESGLFWRTGNPSLSTWDSWNRIITSDANSNISVAGKIGIGLPSSPSQTLDVIGRLKFRSTGSGSSGVWFTGNDGTETAFLGQLGTTSSDQLGIWHGGAWRFAVANTGDVSVGVDDGSTINGYGAKLQLLGASLNGDPLWISRYNNGNNQSEMRVNIGDDLGQSQDMFVVGTNYWSDGLWHPLLAVQASGNVGIGNTSSSAKLQINGNGAGSTALSIIENPGSAVGAHFVSEGANNIKFQLKLTGDNSVNTELRSGGDSFLNARYGNVGIGTTSPDAKLAVKGQVHAQEVKVDLNGAVAPDYVFEKDYKLASLEEIKNYIDQNKHLPEVPSAREMEKNGIQIGEMNMLLLKKIEELTLYVLKQQQQINGQQKEIDQLKRDK